MMWLKTVLHRAPNEDISNTCKQNSIFQNKKQLLHYFLSYMLSFFQSWKIKLDHGTYKAQVHFYCSLHA